MASTRVRLGTVQENGGEHPVLVRDDGLLPLDEALDGAPSDLRGLVAAWRTWSGPVRALADGGNAHHRLLPAEKAYWCPPLIPPKLLCVGSNYRDHVAEMEGPAGVSGGPPPFPYSFLKPASALVGSGREVRHPSPWPQARLGSGARRRDRRRPRGARPRPAGRGLWVHDPQRSLAARLPSVPARARPGRDRQQGLRRGGSDGSVDHPPGRRCPTRRTSRSSSPSTASRCSAPRRRT